MWQPESSIVGAIPCGRPAWWSSALVVARSGGRPLWWSSALVVARSGGRPLWWSPALVVAGLVVAGLVVAGLVIARCLVAQSGHKSKKWEERKMSKKPYNPDTYRRKPLRLPKHDYTWTGAYYVTIRAEQHEPVFDIPELRSIQIKNNSSMVQPPQRKKSNMAWTRLATELQRSCNTRYR